MPEITTRNGTEVAHDGQGNYFTQYGEQASQRNIVGRLLKFSKGDYLVGEHNVEMPRNTELAANMDELMIGWIKWQDNKPVEQIMGRLADGYQPLKRKELDDQDESQWERDDDDEPRDPWQYSNYLIMKTPGESDPEEGLFTFATSSKGGIGAIGELCKAYGKAMRSRPDEFPIVKLDVGSYAHSNKQFGRIKFPIFEIIGWISKTELHEALGHAAAAAAAEDKPHKTDIPF
jgi:hypothetical protein